MHLFLYCRFPPDGLLYAAEAERDLLAIAKVLVKVGVDIRCFRFTYKAVRLSV